MDLLKLGILTKPNEPQWIFRTFNYSLFLSVLDTNISTIIITNIWKWY